jgi:hypothetical protein
MKYFINFNVNTGISIDTYRGASGYANSDVAGLVDDIVNGVDGNCPLEGAKEALEDGAVWSNSAATPDVLELLHGTITHFEDACGD